MKTCKNAAAPFANVPLKALEIFYLDVAGEIFACQARTPEKIEHCARKMLRRLAGDFSPLVDRQLIAKRNLEIVQCDFVSMPVKDRHERSQRLAEMEAGFAREQRHKLHREPKSDPFKPVPD